MSDRSSQDMPTNERRFAYRACEFCRSRKGKCDRTLPQCTPCTLAHRACVFGRATQPRNHTRTRSRREPSHVRTPSSLDTEPRQRSPDPPDPPTKLAAFWSLDQNVFERSVTQTNLLSGEISMPKDVLRLFPTLIALRAVAAQHFETTARWLPLVFPAAFLETDLSPLSPPTTSTYFLCLCMSLHQQTITQDQEPQHVQSYLLARKLGDQLQPPLPHHSIRILQGWILILVYEMGQALHPAASMTLARCVQYSTFLGLGFDESSVHQRCSPTNQEERRRAWWALYIIERVANMGRSHPLFLVPTPALAARLPCDDAQWAQGSFEDAHYTLKTPPGRVDGFASQAQAAYLIGSAYQGVSYQHDPTGPDQVAFDEECCKQFERTINAQIAVIQDLSKANSPLECTHSVLCHCAFGVLAEHLYREKHDGMKERCSERLTRAALYFAESYANEDAPLSLPSIPPYVLPLLYFAAKRLYLKRQGDVDQILRTLEGLSTQWKAAELYLQLLSATGLMSSA